MKVFFGGGLNENLNPHISEAAKESQNFDLEKDSHQLVPRSPIDLIGTAPNGGDIRGLMQLIKRDDTQTQLVQAAGLVYSWDGASSFTSLATVATTSQLRDTYWSLGDYLVVTDIQKATVVKKWTGSAFSTLTTGLGTDLYAKYGVVHKNRMWLLNVKTSTDTPHLIAVSAFENPESYNTSLRASIDSFTTGREAFYMLSPDLRPINGWSLFNKELVISTEGGGLFRLTGSSALDFAWTEYFPASNAVGAEAMVNIGNDVMYMRRGGNIDLLSTTDRAGDITADDISRFIPDTVDGLSNAIAVYDQQRQKVLFFVSSKVLVFFKDIFYGGAVADDKNNYLKLSPWSVYKTADSGEFNTSAAKYMRIAASQDYTVYFGASNGRVLDLNGDGLSGDAGSSDISVVRKTRLIDDRDNMNFMLHIPRGSVVYRKRNELSVDIELQWSDELNSSTASVVLEGGDESDSGAYFGGAVHFGGSYYFSTGFQFADVNSRKNFSHVGKGPGCKMTVSTNASLNYQIDHIELM